MTENKKASDVAAEYTTAFREHFNQYMSLKAHHPYEELMDYRCFMFKLGLITEIWVTIDKLMKEKYNGRTTKNAAPNSDSTGNDERSI